MDIELRDKFLLLWKKYFNNAELPIIAAPGILRLFYNHKYANNENDNYIHHNNHDVDSS